MQVSSFLDRTLPLDGASHADVVEYTVEIPMRYATCFAVLKDGRKVRFTDRRDFCGWKGYNGKKSLLFRHDDMNIELRTNPGHPVGRETPGHVCDIRLKPAAPTTFESSTCKRYIGLDGSQLLLSK